MVRKCTRPNVKQVYVVCCLQAFTRELFSLATGRDMCFLILRCVFWILAIHSVLGSWKDFLYSL